MQSNKDNNSLITLKRLSANDDYYNIIFKRTERIASAVFYILSHATLDERTRVHYNNVSDRAMALHLAAIETLTLFENQIEDGLYPLKQALVVLGSTLKMAVAARLITPEIELVIDEEIDSVLRHLRHHYTGESRLITGQNNSHTNNSTRPIQRPRRTRPNIPANDLSSDAILVYSDLGDRTSRIKTVLEAKPEATIKDLSDIITDVSEKTIQRDLNNLIEKGQVIRQGERRWSKYSIAN
jgi:DNA-binding transcriptional ArsR family regulator